MNSKDRLELANWVVAQAKKSGADDAAVDLSNQRTVDVQCRERKLEQLKEATQNSLSLDVYVNSRYSGHTTNDIRKESLSKFIGEAVAMTKYLSEDPYRRLPDPKYYEGRKEIDLRMYDPTHADVTSEERVRLALAMEDAALSHSDQVISCTAYFSDTVFEAVKVHSNGLEGVRRGTVFDVGAEATVRDGDKGRPDDWDWQTVRFRADLKSPESLGKSAVERALSHVGQTKMESGFYDMCIENRAASRLLGAMYGPMLARNLQRKSSFLEGKLGQKVGSEKLTWIDDPFIPSGLGSRLFDTEGMATKRRAIIEKGVLNSYYIDTYYGRKLEMEPTLGERTNVVFDYSDKSLDDLVKEMKKGILVTSFIGGNSNSTTGDFSYGVMGMYVEDGAIVKPINEMNVSGNLAELWHQLAAVGNDPYMYSSLRRPSMLFRDIQFSGI